MAFTRIISWFGYSLMLCALMMAATMLVAFSVGELSAIIFYGFWAMILSATGGVFYLISYNITASETYRELLWFFLLFWMLMPVILALPYIYFVPSLHFLEAYFESVSAFTTTGASRLVAESLPQTLLFWRSLLQWVGGVSAISFAAVILVSLNMTAVSVHRSVLFSFQPGTLFSHLLHVLGMVVSLYGLITLVCCVLLILSGNNVLESLCLALSGISTGGLTPRSGPLESYVSPFGGFVLALTSLIGAMSFVVLWQAVRQRKSHDIRRMVSSIEHRMLGVIILFLFLSSLFFVPYRNVPALCLDIVFFVSSTGFGYAASSLEFIPMAVLVACALIGGASLSTTGGLKLMRLLLLVRHILTDMQRLTHPSRIVPIEFQQQIVPDKDFLSIWMYFICFTLAFGLAIVCLAISGLGLEQAIVSGAATLANMGPLLSVQDIGLTYADFSIWQLSLLSLIMLVGRVEVVAVLAIFSTGLWRK